MYPTIPYADEVHVECKAIAEEIRPVGRYNDADAGTDQMKLVGSWT